MTSRWPVSATAVSTRPWTTPGSRTSPTTIVAPPPDASMRARGLLHGDSVRPHSTTWAPSAPSRSAIARPMPLDAPVTTAVLPDWLAGPGTRLPLDVLAGTPSVGERRARVSLTVTSGHARSRTSASAPSTRSGASPRTVEECSNRPPSSHSRRARSCCSICALRPVLRGEGSAVDHVRARVVRGAGRPSTPRRGPLRVVMRRVESVASEKLVNCDTQLTHHVHFLTNDWAQKHNLR